MDSGRGTTFMMALFVCTFFCFRVSIFSAASNIVKRLIDAAIHVQPHRSQSRLPLSLSFKKKKLVEYTTPDGFETGKYMPYDLFLLQSFKHPVAPLKGGAEGVCETTAASRRRRHGARRARSGSARSTTSTRRPRTSARDARGRRARARWVHLRSTPACA